MYDRESNLFLRPEGNLTDEVSIFLAFLAVLKFKKIKHETVAKKCHFTAQN
jgi:hypothetical protein